ncbi:SDR family oxidoreductase [Polaribacter sp.]|nr:SDR family oxidoreductase [Polaribacter sp.]MDC1533627.1 SDR family oxidoreductase [Polaribacter sp.]
MNLKNKTFLITGATSGIGLELCAQILKHQGDIIGVGRNLNELQKLLINYPENNSKLIKCDLEDQSQIETLTSNCPAVDGIVHSAGFVVNMPFSFFSFDKFKTLRQVNQDSIIQILYSLIKQKKIKNDSSIVFISSISASFAMKANSPYAMTKASLNILSKTLSAEFSKKRIRFNTVSPGMVETQITKDASENLGKDRIDNDRKKYPLGYGEPEDVAKPIIFLLSDYSKWITGIDLFIDGGRTSTI